MRAKLFVVLESVFLGFGLLVLTPSINPTTIGKTSDPPNHRDVPRLASPPNQSKHSEELRKPLAVWECITSWYGEDFDGQPTATARPMICMPTLRLTRRFLSVRSCGW